MDERRAAEESADELERIAAALSHAEDQLKSAKSGLFKLIGRRSDRRYPQPHGELPVVVDRIDNMLQSFLGLHFALGRERNKAMSRRDSRNGVARRGPDADAWKRVAMRTVLERSFAITAALAVAMGRQPWNDDVRREVCNHAADYLASLAYLHELEHSGTWADVKKRWRKLARQVCDELFSRRTD
jgi:hypothetical protein